MTSVLENALRSLLRVRGSQEMDQAVLGMVCELLSARGAVLYQREGEGFRLRASCGSEEPFRTVTPEDAARIVDGLVGARCLGGLGRPGADVRLAAALQCGDDQRLLVLLGPRQDGEPYGPGEAALVESVLDVCCVALENASLFDHLNSLVLIDDLTGCYNRRGFDEHLKVEMVRAHRYRRSISILLLDIDHFKEINDRWGHLVGDAVLRRVGQVLRAEFRTTDVACRFGGDEFAVIFPETPRQDVLRLAERLRARVEQLYPAEPLPRRLTVSLGIAGYPDDAGEPEDLLHAADRALYTAKTRGRNRVASP